MIADRACWMFSASHSPISNLLRLMSKSAEPTLLPQLVLCPERPSEEDAPPLAELPPPPPPSTEDEAVAAMLLSPSAAPLPPPAASALACRRRFFDLVAAPMYFRRAVCADVRGVWNNSSENKGFECTNFTTEAKSCAILELPLLPDEGAPLAALSAVDRRLRIEEVLE